jgi:predicted negative regulator of RcsB-dependent stress response
VARLSRRELKTDEFADRLAIITGFFSRNRKQFLLGGGSVLLAVIVAVGVLLYVRSRQGAASEAFGEALVSYHALVVDAPPEGYTLPTFKTADEKYTEAIRQFTDVSDQFGSYSVGKWARYYTALSQRELGQYAVAEQSLLAIASDGDPDLAAIAKMALAGLYQKTSRTADAEKLYRELESSPTRMVPKPSVQIALAEMYQRTNPSQATAIYQQIEKDYPGTAAADLAARMLRGAAQ